MASIVDDFQTRWWDLERRLMERFGKKPDVEAILFLIGLQEIGLTQEKISKEQKQDLMHIGICRILSLSGYYEFQGADSDGWPHWELVRPLPHGDLLLQEQLLKMHVLEYFKAHDLF